MKRRHFMTSLGMLGGACMIPPFLQSRGFISSAMATSDRDTVLGKIGYSQPSVMPQIISIFLYGGPSELAGNLTNIDEINFNSQNKYPDNLLENSNNSIVTANGFWSNAGGEIMENMINKKRLTVYRTINRVLDDSKAHRPSIFSNLTGLVGETNNRPGIATHLATVLDANNAISDSPLFPFVTFEGESIIFNQGEVSVPLGLKPVSLDRDLRNPYQRSTNNAIGDNDTDIEALATTISNLSSDSRFTKVKQAFTKRGVIESSIEKLRDSLDGNSLPLDPDIIDTPENPAPAISYPNTNIGRRLQAAVTLCTYEEGGTNKGPLFTSLGSGGLGGWDDHDSALDKYSSRMQNLMLALNAAAKHLDALGKTNVVINVFGDFGRNVNLNNSMGWDHGNNQNLFTVSGSDIAGRQLGKIIGRTQWTGTPKVNRQFTTPVVGDNESYQCEPFAIAATLYKYFGMTNPEALTAGIEPINEEAPSEKKV